MAKKMVSYSQFTLYANCPKRWKLDYLQGLRTYEQSIHTCFGSACHKTLQNYLEVLFNKSVKEANAIDLGEYLKQAMFDEYKQSLEKNGGKHYSTPQELSEFHLDGKAILDYFQKHRRTFFSTKDTELVGIEISLNASLIYNIGFTGFIDVVTRSKDTGRYKIWDIKTSTQGWNKYQKADQTKTAQVILYKSFYAEQLGIDPDSIDVEYMILRRKINEGGDFPMKRIQTFIPASGKPTRNKVNKAFTDFLQSSFNEDGSYNEKGNYPAISSSACKYCPYAKEEVLCPKKERINR